MRFSSKACGAATTTLIALALLAPGVAVAAFTASHDQNGTRLVGQSQDETLRLDSSSGYLRHNRYAAGDPGFASATDFDTGTPGEQRVANTAAVQLVVEAKYGAEVIVGSPYAPASGLLGTFHMAASPLTQAWPIAVTVDDSTAKAGRQVTATAEVVQFAGGPSIEMDWTRHLELKAGPGIDTLTIGALGGVRAEIAAGGGDDLFLLGDTTVLGAGSTLDGGPGPDLIDYGAVSGPVTVDLAAGAGTRVPHLVAISNAAGGPAADTLTGTPYANHLSGGPGNDRIDGGIGKDVLNGGPGTADTLDYSKRTAGVVVTLDHQANDGTDADKDGKAEEQDLDQAIERIAGGAGPDILTGNELANELEGNGGQDALDGEQGDDTLDGGPGTDRLDGDGGTGDRVSYASRTTPVAVTLDGAANDGADPNGDGTSTAQEEGDHGIGIEHVTGGAGADRLTGSGVRNQLSGEHGDDTLKGNSGPDVLDGGFGRDTLDYSGDPDSLWVVLDGQGPDGAAGEGDEDRSAENVIGGDGHDTLSAVGAYRNELVGGPGDDYLDGGPLGDVLDGGDGDDTAGYANRPGSDRLAVTLDDEANDGSDPNNDGISSPSEEGDTDLGIEAIDGGAGADRLTGRDGEENFLDGRGGNDTLRGLSAHDVLYGGSGADRMYGGSGEDTLTGESGNDVLSGSAGDDWLAGNDGNDLLTGAQGTDELQGGLGDDVLDGGTDSDEHHGGDGVDLMTYASRTAAQPVIVRLDGMANDGQAGEVDSDSGVENARGGAGSDRLYATKPNAVVNALFGGAGDDVLSTRDGTGTRDRIECGDGADGYNRDLNDVKVDCETFVSRP